MRSWIWAASVSPWAAGILVMVGLFAMTGDNASPALHQPPPSTWPRNPGTHPPPGNDAPPPVYTPNPGVHVPPSAQDASRFLAEATFGPTLPEIDRVRAVGYDKWLDQQFRATPSYQLRYLGTLGTEAVSDLGQRARMEAWFLHALGGPDPFAGAAHQDQLRQRVAFALSEIFVVSEQNPTLGGQTYALASYYDVLARNAFGNYRTLLQDVALQPAMGVYLSTLGNQKPDATKNIRPDENFAREAMQLFSVGLVRLNRDGSTMLDGKGVPIPTYDQFTVRGFAAVYTGWTFSNCGDTPFESCWFYEPSAPAWRTPMAPYANQHASAGTKQLLVYPGVALANGVLPAGGTATSDLKAALDNIFNHPNVGPFISRQLIQRLVTSNPSARYIDRVASVFNDNGHGVRGDLKATVRAILLDPEARYAAYQPAGFGKVREPILRLTHGWRALNARTRTGRMSEYDPEYYLGQAPLRAPSVFNFFSPRYTPTGELSDLKLAAPELQLATDSMVPTTQNAFGDEVFYYYIGNPNVGPSDISVDLSRDAPLAANPASLVDRYNLLFMAGQMSPLMQQTLVARLEAVPNANNGRDRVQEALFLIMNSPEYTVQK